MCHKKCGPGSTAICWSGLSLPIMQFLNRTYSSQHLGQEMQHQETTAIIVPEKPLLLSGYCCAARRPQQATAVKARHLAGPVLISPSTATHVSRCRAAWPQWLLCSCWQICSHASSHPLRLTVRLDVTASNSSAAAEPYLLRRPFTYSCLMRAAGPPQDTQVQNRPRQSLSSSVNTWLRRSTGLFTSHLSSTGCCGCCDCCCSCCPPAGGCCCWLGWCCCAWGCCC